MWVPLALLSAFLTAVVGTISKAGLEKTGSFIGFAIQSSVVMVCAWIALLASGKSRSEIATLEIKSLGLMAIAGVVSCAAFLCYFGAFSAGGDSSRVQPVDRLSLVFAIILAALFLREKASGAVIAGAALMAVGALVIAFAPSSK